ncbi:MULTISPECIES: hypothetical protein [Microbacterium]|uniref:hypothetical protein n=1 Tax=Microbacterium TaxID=33882 RepID=UPI0011EB95F1|nr:MULTISPECIES: hypothetical protein [Microbacterium]
MIAVSGVTAAHADGYNVVGSHGGLGRTELNVKGSGLYVKGADISHNHAAEFYLNLCGHQTKSWGTLRDGGGTKTSYSFKNSGCSWYAFWGYTSPAAYFKHGTTLKGQAYHDKDWAAGIPQVGIWR